MGVWGTSLFADDMACDIRDHYRELLEDGAEDNAATRLVFEKFGAYLEESDGIALLAFAVTQSKLGRLDADIRDRALAALDRGADLETWERENPKLAPKRRAVLEKARSQLTGPQPPRRRLRPPKRISSGLAAGDVLALALPDRVALLRVVRVRQHRLGETPVLKYWTSRALMCQTAISSNAFVPRRSTLASYPRIQRTRGSSHLRCRASIGSVPVSERYKRSALEKATNKRRCQARGYHGPCSPSAWAENPSDWCVDG